MVAIFCIKLGAATSCRAIIEIFDIQEPIIEGQLKPVVQGERGTRAQLPGPAQIAIVDNARSDRANATVIDVCQTKAAAKIELKLLAEIDVIKHITHETQSVDTAGSGIPASPRHVRDVIDFIRAENIPVLFAANYFSQSQVERVASRTGAVAVIVPEHVAGEADIDDYFTLIDTWVSRLSTAFEGRVSATVRGHR